MMGIKLSDVNKFLEIAQAGKQIKDTVDYIKGDPGMKLEITNRPVSVNLQKAEYIQETDTLKVEYIDCNGVSNTIDINAVSGLAKLLDSLK